MLCALTQTHCAELVMEGTDTHSGGVRMDAVQVVVEDLGMQLAAKSIDLAVMKARAEGAEAQLADAMAQLAELQPEEEETEEGDETEGDEIAEVTELHPVDDEETEEDE